MEHYFLFAGIATCIAAYMLVSLSAQPERKRIPVRVEKQRRRF